MESCIMLYITLCISAESFGLAKTFYFFLHFVIMLKIRYNSMVKKNEKKSNFITYLYATTSYM